MVVMSMSSALRPMSGSIFPLIVAFKVHATSVSLAFQGQTLVWACLAFSPSSDELERSSLLGHGQVASYVCSKTVPWFMDVNF